MNPPSSPIRNGFSLIEILIASALSGTIILLVSNTLVSGIKSQRQSAYVTELNKSASHILTDITHQIRWASKVESPDSYTNILKITDSDTPPHTIVYQFNTNQLTKTIDSNPATPLHPTSVIIKDFDLIPYPDAADPNRIAIKFTLEHTQNPNLRINSSHTVSIRITSIQP